MDKSKHMALPGKGGLIGEKQNDYSQALVANERQLEGIIELSRKYKSEPAGFT